MESYLNYTDEKLINILQRLNEDFEKEKAIELPVPTVIAKTYEMCLSQIKTELKSRGVKAPTLLKKNE